VTDVRFAAAPDVEAQVWDCFNAYEDALIAGDVAAMNSWFADDERTVRFGIAEEQWNFEAVRQWRRTAGPVPPGRQLSNTRVAVWSADLAVVTTLFRYPSSSVLGRQSQTWLRTDDGWRIVHAHVSERPLPA
jgi:hypothetical protein